MSYTVKVTKGKAERIGPTEFNITVNVVFKQDSVIVMEKTYSKRYILGQAILSIQTALQNQLKADWDKYKAEQSIFTDAEYNGLCKSLQTLGNTYIKR